MNPNMSKLPAWALVMFRRQDKELKILRNMARCAAMNQHTRGGIPAGIHVALIDYIKAGYKVWPLEKSNGR